MNLQKKDSHVDRLSSRSTASGEVANSFSGIPQFAGRDADLLAPVIEFIFLMNIDLSSVLTSWFRFIV